MEFRVRVPVRCNDERNIARGRIGITVAVTVTTTLVVTLITLI